MKLQNYTLRYLIIAMLGVIALWASLFYVVILDEVYDNVDDGLKNSKILIIREAFANENLLNTPEFGINQFKIKPLPKGDYSQKDKFISTFEFMEYDDDNEPVRLLKTVFNDAKGNPHELTIRASTVEEDELLEDLLTALIALYIMLVVSIVIINHFILKKVWKSFYKLLEKLKSFKLGSGTSFKSPESPIEEFKILGRELEEMLQRNEAIYSSQKQFIENASHELQTPLAISINKLELFAENNILPEDQMIEIGKITDSLSRLVRLNKSLLMLSKIENLQFSDETDVNFNEILEQIIEDFSDLAEFKLVKINLINNGNLTYKMNKGLASTLVSNLLKNALIHNRPNGFVEISISEKSFVIRNSGIDYPLKPDIFERFSRHTLHEQSTGLGLAIVKSIVNSYQLPIHYSFEESHVFKITFLKK